MTTRTWLILLLLTDIAGLALIAIFYLRRRQLSWTGYLLWGIIALIPLMGPFLVILGRPGQTKGH
jgi:hypothetical protein